MTDTNTYASVDQNLAFAQVRETRRLADAVEDLVYLIATTTTTGLMALDNFRRARERGRS